MQAKLHLVKGNPKGKTVEIPPGTLTVGRAEDSDLIIASTRVSRHHCEIVNGNAGLIVRDKGSGNGTAVNGAKVTEQPLKPGDEIQIGPLTFSVEIDGKRGAAAKPAARPAPAPAPARHKPAGPPAKPGGTDVLSSLERMAGGKKKPAGGPAPKKGDDILEISSDDLLDS